MAEYAQHGLRPTADHLNLAMDYFSLSEDEFLERWLPDRDRELGRQTTPESWRTIVESLNNPIQRRIVADDREQTNVLVLAGPGSGKTRVLVHRIAYLVRVRRENPRGILALAYNPSCCRGDQAPPGRPDRRRCPRGHGAPPATRWPCGWWAPVSPDGRTAWTRMISTR